MSTNDTEPNAQPGRQSESGKRVHQAFDAARDFVAGADFDELRTRATGAASALYEEGRDFLANNPEVARAKEELRDSIRKNPLAAIGIAFTAGLLVALLTRG